MFKECVFVKKNLEHLRFDLVQYRIWYDTMEHEVELSYLQVWVVDEEGVVWPVDAVEDHKDEGEQVHCHLVHILLQLLGLFIIHVFSNLSVDPRWLSLDTSLHINK